MNHLLFPSTQEYLRDRRITLIILAVSIAITFSLALAGINRMAMWLLTVLLVMAFLLALRDHLRLAGIVAPLASLYVFAYLIFRNNGLRDTAILGFPVIIIAASLLNGQWGAIVFGGASLLIVIVLGVLETTGVYTTPTTGLNSLDDYLVVSLLILLTVIMQWTVVSRLTKSLQTAREELDERIRTESQLRQRAEEMALLYQIGVALTSGQNLYQALRAFVKELENLMTVDTFYVSFYDTQTDMITYPLYLTFDDDLYFPPRRLSDNPGLTGEVIATRQTLVLPDITLPEIQDKYKIVVIVNLDIHSYVGIPLIMNEQIIGVLSIQARQPNAYTEDQVRMLETLATQVAITAEKSRLFEQLQQELAERKRAEAEIRQLNAELEARVQQRTAQLEDANKDLESFSYSVSHDLRAPLRGIEGFASLLAQEYSPQLNGLGNHFLTRIQESAHRMNQLINDLLAFSRLGRQELFKRPVEPAILLQDILNDFTDLSYRQVDFVIAPDLPICEADPSLLRQVFVNLLDNALKYTRKQDIARIEVNWLQQNGEIVYFVRDNGVGFDMAYADKLFGVFQRLHRADDFEGTGVGLATVHRLINRHGGRIWAEAEVDKGATFLFTLAASKPMV